MENNTNTNTKESVNQRHSKHQQMLKEHEDAKIARKERATTGTPRMHKLDAEILGFKPLVCAKR